MTHSIECSIVKFASFTKMSTQKGNTARSRPQKHQNKTKFKNNLHDKSPWVKLINSLEIDNVCVRCKNIIDWKIKYKKYKPLKAPSTCVKCGNKNVKHAYHTMCSECSSKLKVCPKCGQVKELVESKPVKNIEDLLQSSEVQQAIKSLPERRRRTFYRHVNKSTCDFKTEEEILDKLKEISIGSGGSALFDDEDLDFDDEDLSDESF